MFVKVGLDALRGVMTFIDSDLPKAFRGLDDLHLLSDLADASQDAVLAIGEYVDYLETDVRPRAKASFRLGQERFEQKLRYDEGISLSVDKLLAIAERELRNDAGRIPHDCRTSERRRSDRELAQEEAAVAPGAGTAPRHRARAAARAPDFPAAQLHRLAARREHGRSGRHPRFLPLVVCQHVDAGPVRDTRRSARCIT